MDIIKNFGINPYLLVAQILNFLILFYLLKRFAFKPITAMLEKRKQEIAEGLKSAEAGRHALEKALEEEKKILKKAQAEAQKILQDAKNQADSVAVEMRLQTKAQVEQMLLDAKNQNTRQEQEMEKRVAIFAAELAVKMVKQSISGVFTQEEQQEAIEQFSKKLKSTTVI